MSQRAVERAVGKLVTDEGFRAAFYRAPSIAVRGAGIDLSADELLALSSVPADALAALAARLDDTICSIHVETGGPEWPPDPPTLGAPRQSRGTPRPRKETSS